MSGALRVPRALRPWACALALCAASASSWSAPPDGGVAEMRASLQNKTIGTNPDAVQLAHPALDSAALVQRWLQEPLTADRAVRVALLNNAALQVRLGAYGTGISDAISTTNPIKVRARQEVTLLTLQAYQGWVSAVAASQKLKLLQKAKETALTTAELTRRMAQVGNANKLALARAQAVVSDAALAVAQAQTEAFAAHEQLTVLLGLPAGTFTLPDALPALPAQAPDMPDIEARVLQAREDLSAARDQWLMHLRGPAPQDADGLWDAMGDAAKVRGMAIQLRSQARQALFNTRSAWDVAQHFTTEVLPTQALIHEELTVRYNGMLGSIFELLAHSQAQTLSEKAAVQAQLDFWRAQAELQALLAGAPLDLLGSPSAAGTATGSSSAAGH